MKYFSKTFLICCLVSLGTVLVQFGCSSGSQNAANTQPSVSPSPTADLSSSLVAASPTPAESLAPPVNSAAPINSAAPTERTARAGKAPAGRSSSAGNAGGVGGASGYGPDNSGGRAAASRPPAPPRTFTLESGSVISVFTSSDISTKESRGGQKFTASLANAIVDGDWVIAKRGAPVEGVVVSSDPGGRVKGTASISVRLESITLADGRKLELSTNSYTKEAQASKKKDALKVGGGAALGAIIGGIAGGGKGAAIGAGVGGAGGTGVVLATRGDPAVIPGESQLSFRVMTPVQVTKR